MSFRALKGHMMTAWWLIMDLIPQLNRSLLHNQPEMILFNFKNEGRSVAAECILYVLPGQEE